MKIYILTSQDHPELFYDDKKIVDTCKTKGIEYEISVWDKDVIPDSSLVLIRTIWDYSKKADKFKALLEDFTRRGIKTFNPIDTIKWNMDKSYLVELFNAKAPVVPTYISKNYSDDCINKSEINYPLVLKPLVGASGYDTFLLNSKDSKVNTDALNGREVIIQPFMKDILSEGEISFLYFNGSYSHSVIKSAGNGDFRIQEIHGGNVKRYNASKEELSYIEEILSKVEYEWSYARVDVVRSEGKLLLMELELIEPELFFRFSDNAEKSLIDCLVE